MLPCSLRGPEASLPVGVGGPILLFDGRYRFFPGPTPKGEYTFDLLMFEPGFW